MTASTGGRGYHGGSFPASSSFVTAVRGTSLTKGVNTRGWTETVGSGAGSGYSLYNTAPAAATYFNTKCAKRAMADVSPVADPNTGVAVYDSTAYLGSSGGWSSVAPACRLRSSVRCTRCPAARPGTQMHGPTRPQQPSSTSPQDRTAAVRRFSGAPPELAGTDRLAWERPTA